MFTDDEFASRRIRKRGTLAPLLIMMTVTAAFIATTAGLLSETYGSTTKPVLAELINLVPSNAGEGRNS